MKTNADQGTKCGTQGTILFGGALQLFQWDGGKQVGKEAQPCAPLISNSSNRRNAYKWTRGFNVFWTCYLVGKAGFSSWSELGTAPAWRGSAALPGPDSAVVGVQRTGRASAPRFQAKLRKAQSRIAAGMIPPFFLGFLSSTGSTSEHSSAETQSAPLCSRSGERIINRAGARSPWTMLSVTFPALQCNQDKNHVLYPHLGSSTAHLNLESVHSGN